MKKLISILLLFLFLTLTSSCDFSQIKITHAETNTYSFYLEPDYDYDCTSIKEMILDEFTTANGYSIYGRINEYFFLNYYYNENAIEPNNKYQPKFYDPYITKVSPKEVEDYYNLKLFYVSYVCNIDPSLLNYDLELNKTFPSPVCCNMLFMLYNSKIYRMSTYEIQSDVFALGAYCFTIYGSKGEFKLDYLETSSSRKFYANKYTFDSKSQSLTMTSFMYCTCLEDETYNYTYDDYYHEEVIIDGKIHQSAVAPYIKRRPLYVIQYNQDGELNYFLANDNIKLTDYYYDDEVVPTKYISTIKFMKPIIPDFVDSTTDVFALFKDA